MMDITGISVALKDSGAVVGISTLDGNEDYDHKEHAFTTVKEALEFLKSLVEEEMKKHG